MKHKVLVLLPNTNDRAEAVKLDKRQYEVHFLHASDDVKDKAMPTFAYDRYVTQPGFLTTYVDKAVAYVEENGIKAIMYGHDMSSVLASVVCERTGLRGPSLESTFTCLHKYYSRKTENTSLWFDYIPLDEPGESWKAKLRYPCFIKTPFLAGSKGCSTIRDEAELGVALASIRQLVSPFFKGYSEFFGKYLDLEKFPLAVQNIAMVEELVPSGDQYFIEAWMDEQGVFSPNSIANEPLSPKSRDILIACVFPQLTLNEVELEKLVKTAEETGRRFGLRNTFYNVEVWKNGSEFTVVEVNCRCLSIMSAMYERMYGASVYEAAVYLACGEKEKIKEKTPALSYEDGAPISGLFYVFTRGEGKGKNFIDFEYARNGSIVDGAYHNAAQGVELFVGEESLVRQTSTTAVNLCNFFFTANSSAEFFQRVKEIKKKLLLRAEDRDLVDVLIVPI